MFKFKIFVQGEIKNEKGPNRDNSCYVFTDRLDDADALVVGEGPEYDAVRATGNAFVTVEDAVQSLVCRYVDLVSCSKNEKQEREESSKAGLESAKNSLRTAIKVVDDQKERKLLEYAKKNNVPLHSTGMVVFAPPGSGKTTFVKKHDGWSDVDDIAYDLGLHTEHWEQQNRKRAEHYKIIDGWLEVMKRVGFHVMGSLYWNYVPDAIVLIPEVTHKTYVDKRDDLKWEDVQPHRDFLRKLAQEHDIRIFSSFAEVVTAEA